MATESGETIVDDPAPDANAVANSAVESDVLPADDDFVTGGEGQAAASQETQQGDPSESTSPSAAEGATSPAPDAPDWRANLGQQFGVNLGVYDRPEAALESALFAVRQAAQQRHEYEQRLAERERQLAEFNQAQARAEAERVKREEDAAKKTKRQVPEWNPEFEALLTRDAEGNIVARPGADPTLPAKYLAHQRWLAAEQHRMAADPAGYMAEHVLPTFQETITRQVEERVQSILAEQEAKAAATRMIDEIRPWAFTQGPNGQAVPTAAGQLYYQHMQQLSPAGQPDPVAHQYAKSAALLGILQEQNAQLQQQLAQFTGNSTGGAQAGVSPALSKQQQQTSHLREVNQPVQARGNRAGGVNRAVRPVMTPAEIQADFARRVSAAGLKGEDAMIRRN